MPTPNWPVSAKAVSLHQKALVWDNHVCLPHSHDLHWMRELERHKNAGVDVVMVNIGDSDISFETQVSMANFYRTYMLQNPQHFRLIQCFDDIEAARSNGQMAVGFDVEGFHTLGHRIERIALYKELGVGWILMAYNLNNTVASGCHDEDTGLTEFGYEVIAEMDRVGIVKCCTHTGYRAAMDVLSHTDVPTIFSHSNPRALVDHARNIPDELMLACAKTGGVVSINGINFFLGCPGEPTAQDVVNHIDYAVNLIGAEHVAIGTDYVYNKAGMNLLKDDKSEKLDFWPARFGYSGAFHCMPPETFPLLTEEMLKRGYGEDTISGILGANMLRVAKAVWG